MHERDDSRRDYALPDVAATRALGAALADALPSDVAPALVVYLEGDLGAGKTTLVAGLLQKLGSPGPVKSPTYTLLEPYVISRLHLYHFDFYRFEQPEEFFDAGFEEIFAGAGVCLVEWPERAQPYLPPADLVVRLQHAPPGRHAVLDAQSARGRAWLAALPQALAAASCAPAAPS